MGRCVLIVGRHVFVGRQVLRSRRAEAEELVRGSAIVFSTTDAE